jgi:TolA-binding protein
MALAAAVAATCLIVLPACPDKQAGSAFLQARELVTQGQYEAAIPMLESYLETTPQGKHASRAGLFLGKANLALGKVEEARKAWRMTVETYPTTLEGHKCRYKLAFLDAMEGKDQQAYEAFRALAENPDGPLAPESIAWAAYLKKRMAEEQ